MIASKMYFRIFSITFLLFQLLAQITVSQNIAEIVQPVCKNRQIKYKLLSDLRKHKLNGILVYSSTVNYTQSFINDLSLIQGNAGIISPAFVTQKD